MRGPSLVGGSGSSSSKTPCCSKVGIKRGPWTPEEDEVLANYIKREGEGRWRTLPKRAGLLRCGKSCRLRWMNYLRPSVKRGRIAPDEEDLILRLHRLLGNRWALIAGRIPGRTDNEIKNYWNTHLSKKLISQGIDPRTHKPLSNLINHSSSHDQVISSHDPVPNSNPITSNLSNSSALAGENTVNTHITPTNLQEYQQQQPPPYDQNQLQVNADNGMMAWRNSDASATLVDGQPSSCIGNEGYNYIENCNEDHILSTFLDSLMNDNLFVNQPQPQPQQQLQPNNMAVASTQNFNHGNMWEAEIMSSMVGFGNEQNSFDNHQQQLP